jgi:hypothetical protein
MPLCQVFTVTYSLPPGYTYDSPPLNLHQGGSAGLDFLASVNLLDDGQSLVDGDAGASEDGKKRGETDTEPDLRTRVLLARGVGVVRIEVTNRGRTVRAERITAPPTTKEETR